MIKALAVSLLLTLALELAFALGRGLRGKRNLSVVAIANCLTNPPVVLLHHTAVYALGWPNAPVTLVLEFAAVLVEWRCYAACLRQMKHPLLFSAAANIFSYGVGYVLNLLL